MHCLRCRIVVLIALAACAGERNAPAGAVAVAVVGEPEAILPPLAYETVARDIGDLVYERLATLDPAGAPVDTAAYRPALAVRWERLDSLTWRFHLRPGALWHDGTPVSAEDVVFSFEAYADTALAAAAQYAIAGRVSAAAPDDSTVLVRFAASSPEQLYDATWHVRILPRHLWQDVPRDQWGRDTSLARLAGSGPYRVVAWRRGENLMLEADTLRPDSLRPGIARVVWRFTGDPDAALNLLLAGEADLLESIGAPDRIARVAADSTLLVVRYPSAVYGFAGFRIGQGTRAHPLFTDRAVRRGLAMAIDRAAIAANVYGADARVPAGPMSALLWVGYDRPGTVPHDPAASGQVLDAARWRLGRDGVRRKDGRRLAFEILVPSSSPSRRQAAVAMQEMWRQAGAAAEVTAVEFPVFQERLARGNFDVYIGAYLDEPSARGLADQWGTSGIGVLNHGQYSNPVVDSLLAAAARVAGREPAKALYHAALDSLNADAAAIYLYTPIQAAAVRRGIEHVTIDPYSWLSRLPVWTVSSER
jgi:peptide/nickel transport system substrate-binding protein